jgi:CRISPR-associated endonuclease/helicase Cas3
MNLPSFEQYFRALWGYDPFPWQIRLSRSLENGDWQKWITLPTGTGKTTTLDIAIYALARQAHLPGNERKAPVRIVFAVNRRIVVDEAFERVKKIATKLKDALCQRENPLHPVALALQLLAGPDAPPLEAYPLRGATYTDHAWTRSPTQPLVITTTLDQLGSRLLFRGYGCSVGARPMHAALLTHDALLLLDEAHTARAFSETLLGVARWREHAGESIGLPFAAVQLTATPPKDAESPFVLDDADRNDPHIKARLAATKPTTLIPVPGAKAKDRHKKMAGQCQTLINEITADPTAFHLRRVLIVVNRVDSATQIHETLEKSARAHGFAVELLTGGLRPLDRETLVAHLEKTYQLQSSAPAPDVPKLILVATQCIEVGADFDFDALITELAPLDALRQRFGRLNRYGRQARTPAWILAPEEALDEKKADPLYGTCLPAVWNWLTTHQDGLDLGLAAYDAIKPPDDDIGGMLAPAPLAPLLLPAHLDLLCQTSPAPHHEPEPSLYIHGPQRDYPTVSVVLRNLPTERAKDILEALPPLSTEAATIPLHHVRSWLLGDRTSEDSDAPASVETGSDLKQKGTFPLAWRYSNNEATLLVSPGNLRSGDVLILPLNTPDLAALIPGLPTDPAALDQLERAHLLARDKVLLNLSNARLADILKELPPEAQAECGALLASVREEEQTRLDEGDEVPFCKSAWDKCLPSLIRLLAANLDGEVWQWAATPTAKWRIEPHPDGGIIAKNPARVGFTPWPMEPDDLGGQGNDGSASPSLDEHQDGVKRRLAAATAKLGLTPAIQSALALAARYHDIGKADPRFQAWLHGCTIWQATGRPLVAKSDYATSQIKRFQKLSGTPNGFRHELLSTLIVGNSAMAADHPERDLLLHLIASHHGYCRASAPVVPDTEPEAFTATIEGEAIDYTGRSSPLAHFGEGVPERFWRLTRRFGWWGLAYLETLLRLADQRESANLFQPENRLT